MKIPFDIKLRPQIESGEYKVETRLGNPARIICWDAKVESFPSGKDKRIVSLILDPETGIEHLTHHFTNGKVWEEESKSDLFIVTPEPELTDFELAILCNVNAYVYAKDEMSKAGARATAKAFLKLAKKELCKSSWVPANNLPDSDRIVFTCVSDNGIPQCVGFGYYKHGAWVDEEGNHNYPDYWMEIPELPKEGK